MVYFKVFYYITDIFGNIVERFTSEGERDRVLDVMLDEGQQVRWSDEVVDSPLNYLGCISKHICYNFYEAFISKANHTAAEIEAVSDHYVHKEVSEGDTWKVFIGKKKELTRFFNDAVEALF